MDLKEKNREYQVLNEKWDSEILTLKHNCNPDLKVLLVKNFSYLLKIRDQWDELVLNSSTATVFQTFDWSYNWWNYFILINKNTPQILLIYSDSKLIGIAPFFIQNYSFGNLNIFRQLKLLGSALNSGKSGSNAIEEHGISDYLDLIVLDGYEDLVVDAVESYLSYFKYFYDDVEFQNISDESFIFKYLLPRLLTKNYHVKVSDTDICPKLEVPESNARYISGLKSGTRRKIRQIQKCIANGSGIEIINVRPSDFENLFQELKKLHQRRWNELGYLGLFSDKRFENFIQHVSKTFLEKDWLWFKVVKHEKKIIAVRLAYKFKDRIYDYLSGFNHNQSVSTLRPGLTLIYMMIMDAISENFKTVDFLRGEEDYKFELSSSLARNFRINAVPQNLQSGYESGSFKYLKLYLKLMFRSRSEIAIANLHLRRYGKLRFIFHYVKFCFNRIQPSKRINKLRNRNANRVSLSDTKKQFAEQFSKSRTKSLTEETEEIEVHQ